MPTIDRSEDTAVPMATVERLYDVLGMLEREEFDYPGDAENLRKEVNQLITGIRSIASRVISECCETDTFPPSHMQVLYNVSEGALRQAAADSFERLTGCLPIDGQ